MQIILRERENLLRFSRTIGRRSWILFGYMGYVFPDYTFVSTQTVGASAPTVFVSKRPTTEVSMSARFCIYDKIR